VSKRQGIQELQARLASRLAAKDQSGALASWLAVEAGGQRFLLPLSQSGELFHPTPLVKVPYTKHWFLGLVNLRGALYGVADLVNLPLLGLSSGGKSWTHSIYSRFIVLPSMGDTLCTLAVDRVLGLKASQGFQLAQEASEQGEDPILRRLVDEAGVGWFEVNLVKLSASSEFLNIHERPVGPEH
jgi:twitching motility protein PilI